MMNWLCDETYCNSVVSHSHLPVCVGMLLCALSPAWSWYGQPLYLPCRRHTSDHRLFLLLWSRVMSVVFDMAFPVVGL